MTDRYAVIGHPVSHSKSPRIHTAFAQQTQQDLVYTAIESPLEGFAATVHAFQHAAGRGCNVTVPFKVEAVALATDKRDRARLAGAANALKFEADGRIVADNFDGIGLVRDLRDHLGRTLKGERVLLLGAGGAVRGALLPLLEASPAALVVANRHRERASALASDFKPLDARGIVSACGFEDLAGERFDLVINATSASLAGAQLAIPSGVYAPGALAYDMVYGMGLTPFLQHAQRSGVAQLADGVGMLVEQAAEAFAWWRGVRPDARAVIDALRVPLR